MNLPSVYCVLKLMPKRGAFISLDFSYSGEIKVVQLKNVSFSFIQVSVNFTAAMLRTLSPKEAILLFSF